MSNIPPPTPHPGGPFSQPEGTSDLSAPLSPPAEPQLTGSVGAEGPPAPALARRSWGVSIATGLVGVALGIGGTLGAQGLSAGVAQNAILTDAIETCDLEDSSGLRLADSSRTLTFDHQGEDETTGASILDLFCLFNALEMPEYISSHMGQTTSMDGRQTETWGNLEVSWSYHPKRGMDGVITVRDK